ncbi:hypothetical protein JUJ52_05245 [Virgibacillus sp. AGTR]|uniref:hypothetical protein n=1 Tax=Virgibacillus TaxID=84406 RepID=UPI00196279E7|nr:MULTISPECIES: hypothetical protein [Virgibacillus]MCC2249369.1 hypothetical protein [Virgibacillus sp. AGTR]QRZ18834.1 hypothetical protein JUJ52_03595 [Virgibacillus sp. AGTR]WBX81590.1 hypothetical protein PD280_07820 [Virgibacillus salarius]
MITSPTFSKAFTVVDTKGNEIAMFKRMNHFFSSPAYELVKHTNHISMAELVIVVMGVNAIEKRKQSSSTNSAGGSI